jgi:hypothetical protein
MAICMEEDKCYVDWTTAAQNSTAPLAGKKGKRKALQPDRPQLNRAGSLIYNTMTDDRARKRWTKTTPHTKRTAPERSRSLVLQSSSAWIGTSSSAFRMPGIGFADDAADLRPGYLDSRRARLAPERDRFRERASREQQRTIVCSGRAIVPGTIRRRGFCRAARGS